MPSNGLSSFSPFTYSMAIKCGTKQKCHHFEQSLIFRVLYPAVTLRLSLCIYVSIYKCVYIYIYTYTVSLYPIRFHDIFPMISQYILLHPSISRSDPRSERAVRLVFQRARSSAPCTGLEGRWGHDLPRAVPTGVGNVSAPQLSYHFYISRVVNIDCFGE